MRTQVDAIAAPAPAPRSTPLGVWFIRTVDGVDLDDPVEAAQGRPVFELHPANGAKP
jgi:hypothetical protein